MRRFRIVAVLTLVACGGESTRPDLPATVTVSPAALDLNPDGTSQLTATPKSASGATLNNPVTWSSSSDAVATVSGAGLVTGVSAGAATITARSGSASGTATVTVSPIPVAAVVVTPTTATIEVGDTTRARAATRSASGADLPGRTVTWTSADPAVGAVAQTGLITAVAAGTTTISATSEGKTGTLALTVTPAAVATVTITPATGTLIVATTRQLAATLKDARGVTLTNRPVTWTSTDPTTVSVSSSGLVTAIKLGGPVTITAASEGKQGILSLTVIPVPAARVTVTTPSSEVNDGATVQLAAVATDSAGIPINGRTFTWVSDSTSIATVDANGLVRTHRAGVARIRARADAAEGSVNLVVRGMLHRWTFDEEGGPGTTFRDDIRGRTASLVRVGTLAGAAVGGQVTLTGGARSNADYVALPAGLLRNAVDATIEVWATLHTYKAWSRVFDAGSSTANNLFIAWSRGIDPLSDRVGFTIGGVENRTDGVIAPYTRDLQHHIVLAIDAGAGTGGKTRITAYLDGAKRGEFETAYLLRDLVDDNFWLGRSHHADETANASYDEVRIHDRVYSATEVQASYLHGPVRGAAPSSLSILAPAGIGDTVRGIDVSFPLRVVGTDARGRRYPVPVARWTSANAAVATIDSTGQVRVRAGGRVDVTAVVSNTAVRWTSEAVRVRRLRVDPFLATPAAGAIWEIPVVIIAYIPTADATLMDVRKSPDFWELLPLSIDTVEQRILDYARRAKLGREQGSRFRGYKDPLALPSLGFRITDIFVTYEIIPAGTIRHPLEAGNPPFPDYHKAFADLNLVTYMQTQGIKEVWDAWSGFGPAFPSYDPAIHDPKDFRTGAESNMSSALTGDISNSYRHPNDLPILGHSWTMLGLPIRRSQAEMLHVVGHQMEALLGYVAQRQDGHPRLFWQDFVGLNASNQWVPGRAGATHFPPNAATDYDYHNTRVIQSDIEDWTPANTGQKTGISRSTWYNLAYPWPGVSSFGQREESQWYVYWFQNFPGRGNRIPHGGNWMTNWWAFVGDWDAAIRSGLGLYGSAPAARVGSGAAYPFSAARVAGSKPWVHEPPARAPRR